MPISQRTPFRQLLRAYGALLDIQESLSKLAAAASPSEPRQPAPYPEWQKELATLQAELAATTALLGTEMDRRQSIDARHYLPQPPFFHTTQPSEFMPFSICTATDFSHPRFIEICRLLTQPFRYHRKLWEWAFIVHHLMKSGDVKSGSRGLVFGVGVEKMPAYFANLGAQIVATDAPGEVGEASGWKNTGQYGASLANIRHLDVVDPSAFDRLVTYETCDMNAIPEHLQGFDFNWSSCCFEHLGDLEAGMQFVINAVEKTLRIGGIAVHTTELNLSSNEDTVKQGHTVIYRRRDIEALIDRLRDRGHYVEDLRIPADAHPLDYHVDVPPYSPEPHLRLMLDGYVATSVGIVVRRGQ